eukprot:4834125-Pyramimonas_sp.AAC.1
MHIEILQLGDTVKYLGRQLGSKKDSGVELEFRIRQACEALMANKSELTCIKYYMASRLRLFSVVTPAVAYGSAYWTGSRPEQQKLQRTAKNVANASRGRKADRRGQRHRS